MKKYNSILNIFMTVGSIFMFVGYFIYFCKLFIWSEGALPQIVAFTVCAALPTIFLLDRKQLLKKLFKKAYLPLKTLYTFALTFYMASFLLLCGYVYGESRQSTDISALPQGMVVVTLGAKVDADGEPGVILRRRLEKTLEVLSEREDLVCIVSGGQGRDEPTSEAECMKNYLVSHGISAERIITEPESHNTIENIKNTVEILDEAKNTTGKYPAVAVITTHFHIPRARILWSRLGIEGASTYFISARGTSPLMMYPTMVREYMSYCKLFIFGT